MKVYNLFVTLLLSAFSVVCFAQTEKINDHDCLNKLSEAFRMASTAENTQAYVGAWPATGLCHGLLVKAPVGTTGKVDVVYAFGEDPRWEKAGEILATGTVKDGELTVSLPRNVGVRYVFSEGKAFYTNKRGTFEGYFSPRTLSK